MVSVPAHCTGCGLDFMPSTIGLTGGASITISNCVIDCPRCGATAHFADGTLRADGDKFRLLSGPNVTREMLLRLRLLVEEAERDPTRLDSVQKEAEAIHPGFGSLFSPTSWSPEVKAALVTAMAAVVLAKCSPSPTINVTPRLIIEIPSPRHTAPRRDPFSIRPLPIRFADNG